MDRPDNEQHSFQLERPMHAKGSQGEWHHRLDPVSGHHQGLVLQRLLRLSGGIGDGHKWDYNGPKTNQQRR
jgi:hypothetical protein